MLILIERNFALAMRKCLRKFQLADYAGGDGGLKVLEEDWEEEEEEHNLRRVASKTILSMNYPNTYSIAKVRMLITIQLHFVVTQMK